MARTHSRNDIISNVQARFRFKQQDQPINRMNGDNFIMQQPKKQIENIGVQTPSPRHSQDLNIKLT